MGIGEKRNKSYDWEIGKFALNYTSYVLKENIIKKILHDVRESVK